MKYNITELRKQSSVYIEKEWKKLEKYSNIKPNTKEAKDFVFNIANPISNFIAFLENN